MERDVLQALAVASIATDKCTTVKKYQAFALFYLTLPACAYIDLILALLADQSKGKRSYSRRAPGASANVTTVYAVEDCDPG